jgi:hypothetical protein
VKREGTDLREVLPEVDHLEEGLLVAATLSERPQALARASFDGCVDELPVTVDLFGREQARNHDEAVAAKRIHERSGSLEGIHGSSLIPRPRSPVRRFPRDPLGPSPGATSRLASARDLR